MNIKSFLNISIPLIFLACAGEEEEKSFCFEGIGEEQECPTVEHLNETEFPFETCGTENIRLTEFEERFDGAADDMERFGTDTSMDDEYDICCYTMVYRDKGGLDICF